ncbi:Prolyl-tRNA synthetase associated domain-containing 1 [Labeo rohita]|uniref:Prolyl-tRNA synthetase associated domain-containing 1 n=1 Tax=Labeo rohita TaxID=84645 RepID=A0A498P1R4_LABRO|nr:Prolyl-tRNA synthetase associated domain-containing 1 [Labeo rohita]
MLSTFAGTVKSHEPGLPPCLEHDIFEGVLSYDVALYLKYFIKKKQWLTYSVLNRRIKQFKYKEMTDLETTFLRTAITEVLPDLPEVTKDILEETLQSLGVETYDDFQFIEESDLLSALRPIQARKVLAAWKRKCQTPETSSSSVSASPVPPATLRHSSPGSSQSSSSSSSKSPDIDWVDTFLIPWDKFPEELMQFLEREKRPSPRMRREMIRILVNEMMRKCSCPSKRNSTEVAKKLVAKYPKSLQDIIEGDVVGPGYHSLVKQLQYRIENVKRSTTPKIRKRKHCTDDSDTDEIPPEQRAAIQDTYGCVNWDVKFLPLEETPESQQEKKEKLKMMSRNNDANLEEVKSLMKLTFYTQRKQVNQGENIKYLLEEWPFWFNELGMAVHFKELTSIGLKETFTRNLEVKGKRLLNYFSSVGVNKNKKFMEAVTKCKVMREQASSCSEDVKEMLLLLLSYFNEKEDAMFHYVEDTCLAEEVDMDKVNLTPTLVACGGSCFTAKRFMLCVDRNVVHDNIPSFISAICMMFGSYYCFNIHYPSELASTLEFLQRILKRRIVWIMHPSP